MKICWDNLENLKYSNKTGMWYGIGGAYKYVEKCNICGEPFLTSYKNIGLFCTLKCSTISKNIGRIVTEEVRYKISIANKGKKRTNTTIQKLKINHKGFKGFHHSEKSREKIRKKISGVNSFFWKGGVREKNLPLYNTYVNQLNWCELVRKDPEDNNILQVKCTYCGKWYTPTQTSVNGRVQGLKGNQGNRENRFYCSNECKQLCPIFHKIKYSAEESGTKQLSREVQPELRQMVFERDNYTCLKCNKTDGLQCHHLEGIRWEPIESADIDKCVTVCKVCHKKIHHIDGCSYDEIKCK